MKNIQIFDFLDSVKKKKFWDVKDTYIYKASLGNHWHIKKFVVLYKHLLVDRDEVNANTLNIISQNFKNYCNSIKDQNLKEDCFKYFFNSGIDQKGKVLDFDKFNDLEKYDDDARKFYMLRLMNEGGDTRTPIFDLISKQINKNLKMSEIVQKLPQIIKTGNEIQKKQKDEGKKIKIRYENADPEVVINDYPATIRNDRQLFSYWGFMPSEEEGYKLNEIGNFIYNCNDEVLLNAIGDHQKFKMRLGNPGLDQMGLKNIDPLDVMKQFKELNDFEDYQVNPAIAIVELLSKLKRFNLTEDYKFIIARLCPFDIEKAYSLIEEKKAYNNNLKSKFEELHKLKKTRNLRNSPVSKTENFVKQLQNFIYGMNTEKSKNENANKYSFIKYENNEIFITEGNEEKFQKYHKYIQLIKEYLDKTYKNLYKDFSINYKINLIDEVYNFISKNKNINNLKKKIYLKKIFSYKQSTLKKIEKDKSSLFFLIHNNWQNYIGEIDYELLILCYTLNFSLQNYEEIKENKDFKIILPKLFQTYEDNNEINNYIKNNLNYFFSAKNKQNFKGLNIKDISKKYDVFEEDLIYLRPEVLKRLSTSGRIRNEKIKKEAISERNKSIIQEIVNKKIKLELCDICQKNTWSDVHHIIPFEFEGPCHKLNYAFLCEKCHSYFTFKTTSPEKTIPAINELKIKNLININNLKFLIKKNLIGIRQINFLLFFKYIHLGQHVELLKQFKLKNSSDETILSKLGLTENRWTRQQQKIFYWRITYNYIAEKENFNYKIDYCDGGCGTNILENKNECHHIIPKEQKFKRHKNKSLLGPNSPFNYAFLCETCHGYFTKDKKEQFKIIDYFKKTGLVSKDNTYKMILNDDLNIEQLDFLKVDNYIDQDDYIWLKEKIELRDYYRSNQL